MKLEVQNIDFAYNGKNVLTDVSSSIEEGDFVALVGPNGSGKSTFIKCLNKILLPQKGAVLLNDQDISITSIKDLAREMAYVPQSEERSIGLNVFDFILTGRKPYITWKPSDKDLKKVAEIIENMHLENLAMKDINKLSGGQQQMVSIARAIAQEPRILLLDEPTASLDMKHQIEIMELLKQFSQKGISIVVALHDINTALRYANKFVMLKNKSVFAEGGKDIISKSNIENLYEINVNLIEKGNELFVFPCYTTQN